MIGISRKGYACGLSCAVYNYRNKSAIPDPVKPADALWTASYWPIDEDPVGHERERIDYLFRVRCFDQANIRGIVVSAENIR
jgi:hypothetical protein